MFIFIRHLPWQIQVLILIVCILLMILNIKKMPKTVPKIITIALLTLILFAINLIFILFVENMGESIGITPKPVGILHYSFVVLFVLSMVLFFIARYQQVKHDEKKRKHFLKGVYGFIIGIILFIIMILL